MVLDYEESKIKEFLLDIGYYRLGFYWNPFEIDDDHNFKEGTTFSNVIKLYYLDVDLRNTLAKYINRIEINFRTKLVYFTSNIHKDSSTWFIDPSVVDKQFIDKIDQFYNQKFRNNNKTIKAHHKKYINDKYAPAWKTIEFFTFGTILYLFRNVKGENIKDRISNEFGVKSYKKFINLLDTIILVRNICAHGDVLFDLRTPKGISVIPDIYFNNHDRSSLDSCIKVISYLLGQVSKNRQKELEFHIKELFAKFIENEPIKDIIINKINYKY